MKNYNDLVKSIKNFMDYEGIDAYDLQRVAKDLCCCRSCDYFIQHYSKDGVPVDFGHCCKGNIPHCKKPSSASCGSWKSD